MLVESLKDANKARHARRSRSPGFNRNKRAWLSESIKVACQALVHEADIQSFDLMRQHSLSAADYGRRHDANRVVALPSPTEFKSLPVEIFGLILMASMSLDPAEHMRRLMNLAAVSRHWREVVLSTPELWVIISDRMSVKELDWSIRRSGSLQLEVLYEDSSSRGVNPVQAKFDEVVMLHRPRWKSLTMKRFHPHVTSSLKDETPALRHLRISFGPTHSIELGNGEHLRVVEVKHVGLPWESSRLTRLEILSLSFLGKEHTPSLSQLISMLVSSPELEVLTLRDVDFDVNSVESMSHDLYPIVCPRLAHITLFDIAYPAYEAILSRLRFPNCQSVTLAPGQTTRTTSPSPEVYHFNHAVGDFVQRVSHLLAAVSRVYVNMCTSDVSVMTHKILADSATPLSKGFSLRLRSTASFEQGKGEELAALMRQVAQLLDLACPGVALDISMFGPSIGGFSVDCLNDFSSVEAITVGGDLSPDVVRFLGTPCTSGAHNDQDRDEKKERWPCPELLTLDMRWALSLRSADVRSWVKDRWEKWEDGHDDDGIEGVVEVVMKKTRKRELWRPRRTTAGNG